MGMRRATRLVTLSVLTALLTALGVVSEQGHAPAAAAAPCSTGLVALTFDDGPASGVTPRLVRVLKDRQVPAVFFMVGERVAWAPAAARAVQQAGFKIGNHSYHHAMMTRQSNDQIRATLRNTDARLRRAGIRPTRLMRPPYGAINPRVRTVIRNAGYVPVLWTAHAADWERVSAATIASRVLRRIHPGNNIVLLHDGIGNSPNTVRAVPTIVRQARARGYCFATLNDRGRPALP